MKIGQLGILNVGSGDTKISFDPANPVERDRAAKIVTDMIRRGYAIMIVVGERDGRPLYQRAIDFDPATCEYIIMGDAPPDVQAVPAQVDAGSLSGANGMKVGDTLIYEIDGRVCKATEFLQDGDASVIFDDGTAGMVKWNLLRPATRGERIGKGVRKAVGRRQRVAAASTTGVAVARTAGG